MTTKPNATFLTALKQANWTPTTAALRARARVLGYIVLPEKNGGFRMFERGGSEWSFSYPTAEVLGREIEWRARWGRAVKKGIEL